MKTILNLAIVTLLFAAPVLPCLAMISVGNLSREQARELGITMKHHRNGEAGIKVWLEYRKEGFLEKLTYIELQLEDKAGKHLASARLQPQPVVHGQEQGLESVAFSADPAQLERSAFMVVAYGSTRGDVGYVLKVKNFIDLQNLEE